MKFSGALPNRPVRSNLLEDEKKMPLALATKTMGKGDELSF